MMRKFLFITSIFLIFSSIYSSCKKDEDTNIPQIVIYTPDEFDNFKITDTVIITAKVTDDKNISAIEIVICNTNFLPVTDRVILNPNVKSIDLYELIVIDDFNLTSGNYYVRIRASDGTNEKNLYKAIRIEGIQRKFKNIISVNQINTNSYQLYALDTIHKPLFTYNGDYISSAVNNDYQQFYICGNVNSNLEAYNLVDNSLAWSVLPDNNPPFPSFENLYFNKNILYVSCSQSYVIGYNRFLNVNFNSFTTSGYTPRKTIRFKDYLIVEEKNNTSNLRLLSLYNYPTGTLKNSTNLSFTINSMFYKDDDEIYLFGNSLNNSAVIYWFDVEDQTYYSPHNMPAGQLKDIVKISNTDYLLIVGNSLYWYQEASNSLTVFISNINAEHIDYEDISQTIVVSNGSVFSFYNFPSAVKTGEYNMPNQIKDFKLLYNKNKE